VAIGGTAAKAHKNANNFGLDELREMALHLKMPTSGSKGDLVDAIIDKSKMLAKIQELVSSEDEDSGSDGGLPGARFIKNKHTVFRLVNLLMRYPAELQRSNLIASREQLQLRQTGSTHPLFARVADEFNDDTNSGGLLQAHEEFEKQNINPETPHQGFITPKKCYQLWKGLVKRYADAAKKWGRSGTGNELTFWNFCGKPAKRELDVLYLRLILNSTGDVSLMSYCAEGCEVEVPSYTLILCTRRLPPSDRATFVNYTVSASLSYKRRRYRLYSQYAYNTPL
jgi:hypothetical protein